MIRIILMLMIALPVFLSTAVFADQSGPYLGVNAGANLFDEASKNENSLGTFNLDYEPGYQTSLTLGYRLAPNSRHGNGRVELEIGYRQNSLDQIEFSDGKFTATGEASVWSLMVNTFGEYATETRWTPYVGAGLGMAMVSLQGVEVDGTAVVDDDDLVLAYQIGVGVGYALSSAVDLDLGYRFFGTSNPGFTDVDGVEFDSEYYAHNLQLGIRISF